MCRGVSLLQVGAARQFILGESVTSLPLLAHADQLATRGGWTGANWRTLSFRTSGPMEVEPPPLSRIHDPYLPDR